MAQAKAKILLGCMAFAVAFSCTSTDVEVKDPTETPQVDDQFLIHGRVCTEPPDDSDFPVKIMFVVDCSGSLQQTDEGDHRVEAVRQVIRRFANNPQVLFDVIKFNAFVADLTTGFKTGNLILSSLDAEVFGSNGLLQADSMTDYQGALGKAYQVLLHDMMGVANGQGGLAALTRTKYVIIFFSDGTPDPVCFGCSTDEQSPRYYSECEDDYHVMCQTLDDQGNPLDLDMQAVFEQHADGAGVFPELAEGADYNQNYQIFQYIQAIMDLKETFHVGEMRLHSAFLYCRDQFGNPTSALCEAAELAYHLDPERGRALLREMARRGSGTFRDFTSGQNINFLQIDYTSIKRTYAAKNLLVTNTNAFPSVSRFIPDSDGDGLDDDLELRLGTDPLKVDSDGDSYSDWVEVRFQNAGFDPLKEDRPDRSCQDQNDLDGDGLAGCEEELFGTNPKLVDTDADGLPDGAEVRAGMDPLNNDIDLDLDSDGQRNGDELLYHSDPSRSDQDLWKDHRYWYELRPEEGTQEGQECYGFDIRYMTLVTTLDRNGPGTRGLNDILLWFDQSSKDDPLDTGKFRVACVRAQYIAPDYKVPLSGEMDLLDEDFVDPQDLDLSFSGGSCVSASR
jgi:hypothetical protein